MNGMTGGARRRRTHLRRQIAGRLPVLLAVLVLAGCSVVERPASHRLRDEIARIRAAGEPLTFEQLRAGQAAGDGADAASDYRAAAVLLVDVDSGPLFDLVKAYRAGTKSCPPVPPSTEVRERALRMLAESQPALDLIDRAARDEACHYALNLETGEFPRFAVFHTAGVLLSLRTLDFAFAGAGDRAAASLFAATRAGRVAIAVERYRRRQGKLPASLTDLAPPLPADPFTGHDLLYRRAEDALVVASTGPARAADARAVDEEGRPQGISVCFARPGR